MGAMEEIYYCVQCGGDLDPYTDIHGGFSDCCMADYGVELSVADDPRGE